MDRLSGCVGESLFMEVKGLICRGARVRVIWKRQLTRVLLVVWSAVGLSAADEVFDASRDERLAFFAETASIRAAVASGNFERFRALLDAHPSWRNGADLEGNTLLISAAEKGRPAMVALLLERGAVMTATNQTGHTALHCAALSGQAETVALLLKHGADSQARCARGKTPFDEASEKGHTRVLELFLAEGASARDRDPQGDTPFHRASGSGNIDLMTTLLTNRAEVAATNMAGHTPLHLAALNGQTNAVAFLLRHGADLQARCVRGMTPVQEAAGNGHTAAVAMLLASGASDQGVNVEGDTILHLAVRSGKADLVELLLARSVDAGMTNLVGDTPLHVAAGQGNTAIVEKLLAHGVDAAPENAEHLTPLDKAASGRHEATQRQLRLELARLTERQLERRLQVLVLPFRNGTGDADLDHWQGTAASLLKDALDEAPMLHVLDDSAAQYGLRALHLSAGDALGPEQAQKIGQLAQARRIVWGEFARSDGQWTLCAEAVSVATGVRAGPFRATASDWFALRDQIIDQLAVEWDLPRTPELIAKLRQHQITSADALLHFSRAAAAWDANRSMAEIEAYCRRAGAVDPAAVSVQTQLAASLISQGRLAEGEVILEALVADRPEVPEVHIASGHVLLVKGDRTAAQRELRAGLRLGPERIVAHVLMGEFFNSAGEREMALHHWTQARALQPTDPAVHAHLAMAFAQGGERAEALREIQEVERLDPTGHDINSLQMVTRAYLALGDAEPAVAWGERLLRLGRSLGIYPELMESFAEAVDEVRARLVATPVKAARPRKYSEPELQAALAARLTPEERRGAVNPLASSPALEQWARELTAQAAQPRARAQALFDELSRRPRTPSPSGGRTALEVFRGWGRLEEQFNCNEFAKLYVALARAVGLDACFVHLELDHRGNVVYHDCAIVFLEDEAFLVDPAYRWFGVPHREFIVLDDLQCLAHHLGQGHAPGGSEAGIRIALKLYPELAWQHVVLASILAEAERFGEAEAELERAQGLEPDRWDWFLVKGMIEAKRERPEPALAYLGEALQRNPGSALAYLWSGLVFENQGKLREARDAYRAGLTHAADFNQQQTATRLLAQANERLGAAASQP